LNVATIAQTVRAAQSRGLDRLDAQLLTLHALGKPAHDRAWLLAHDTDELPTQALAALDTCLNRRFSGEPLAYITGHKEFFGLDLMVDKRVLVPRPDTEMLVEWALKVLGEISFQVAPVSVLDLGTGSGAIALALKATRPILQVTALDESDGALTVARQNADRLQLNINFRQSSWLDGVSHKYHVIVSNPPYIATGDPHLAALAHEPTQALTSGVDGLDDIRHIINHGSGYLHAGGWLLLEHGHDQSAAVRALLLAAGFADVQSRRDLSGIERCSGGRTKMVSQANGSCRNPASTHQ
jgi:release factor glutamine methyltransferase